MNAETSVNAGSLPATLPDIGKLVDERNKAIRKPS